MKKLFLLLGVCGLFVACSKSDCDCEAVMSQITVPLYDEGSATITDYDGDCEELNWSNLSSQWAAYEGEGVTLKCKEH
jgi:hypothetical protein